MAEDRLVIDRFKGDYAYLSNFYWETSGTTVEHRFQASKAKNHPEDVLYQCLSSGGIRTEVSLCTKPWL